MLSCKLTGETNILDTKTNRNAELLNYYHLVVSWVRLVGKTVSQTKQAQTYSEGMLHKASRGLSPELLHFTPLSEFFSLTKRKLGFKWILFTSIVKAAMRSCGQKLLGA